MKILWLKSWLKSKFSVIIAAFLLPIWISINHKFPVLYSFSFTLRFFIKLISNRHAENPNAEIRVVCRYMIFFSLCLKSILLYIRKSKILNESRKAANTKANHTLGFAIHCQAQTEQTQGSIMGEDWCARPNSSLERLGLCQKKQPLTMTLTREAVWQ